MKSRIKKIIIGVGITLVSISIFEPLRAQGSGTDIAVILAEIKEDTGKILLKVNELPDKIEAIEKELTAFYMAVNGADSDEKSASAALQADFATLYNINLANDAARKSLQSQLVSAFLTINFANRDGNGVIQRDKDGNVTLSSPSNVNDLIYQTLLGISPTVIPPSSSSPPPGLNFVINASGVTAYHVPPKDSWQGAQINKESYTGYYNSANAIQTFNSYVLSRLYSDGLKQGESSLSDQQAKLVKEASTSDWFSKVASENISVVIRQILMYNSQMFVIMTQMLQTQREQLAAQAMTNTLFIWANNFTENQLLDKAQRKQ